MTTRFVETKHQRQMAARFIEQQTLPFAMTVERASHRSAHQNRLQRQWMNDIAAQIEGHDAEYWRGFCKLHFAVPIMRQGSEGFRATYDEVIRPLPYEQKIKLMCVPLDLPVTRLMNTKQMTAYLDAVQAHFAAQGVVLTDPEALKWGAAA